MLLLQKSLTLWTNTSYWALKMKNKLYLIILLSLILNYEAVSKVDTIPLSRNSIYLEIVGIGGYGSLNYERIVFKTNWFKFGLRAGLSTYNISDYTSKFNPDIIIPLSVNGLYGNNHKLEFGIGQTISNIVQANPSNWKTERLTNIHANFTIGYRYQKKQGGVIFRCSYTPIIELYKHFRHWGGISIGYAF